MKVKGLLSTKFNSIAEQILEQLGELRGIGIHLGESGVGDDRSKLFWVIGPINSSCSFTTGR